MRARALFVLALALPACQPQSKPLAPAATCYPDLPKPQLAVLGPDADTYLTPRGMFRRYRFGVTNWSQFPEELFALAPDLPACREQPASRTWIITYAAGGKQIYRTCQIESNEQLQDKWFGVQDGTPVPEAVYVVLWDRRCGIRYTSDPTPAAAR